MSGSRDWCQRRWEKVDDNANVLVKTKTTRVTIERQCLISAVLMLGGESSSPPMMARALGTKMS